MRSYNDVIAVNFWFLDEIVLALLKIMLSAVI